VKWACWFDRHAWKVRGVTALVRHLQSGITCPVTEILLVCECGELKTAELDGRWTLEQLQTPCDKSESYAEFCRELGVKA